MDWRCEEGQLGGVKAVWWCDVRRLGRAEGDWWCEERQLGGVMLGKVRRCGKSARRSKEEAARWRSKEK